MQGATLTYFGYTGFETSSTLTSEAINPLKDIPRAIIFTVVFCMIIYSVTAISVVGVGIVEASKNHDADTALAIAFSLAGVNWMAQVIYFSALLGVTACTLANLLAQTRINSSLAKDGLFYPVMAELDAKT